MTDRVRVAIHQPQYWPWPRYMHKALSADTFIYLDTAQFSKNGVQNRNEVKSPAGPVWLTLPVKHHLGQTIMQTQIADPRAALKHLKTIGGNYARAAGWQRWKGEIETILTAPYGCLADLAIATTDWMLEKLGATTKRVRASTMGGGAAEASARVAELCAAAGGQAYLTGTGALEYMQREDFDARGCEVWVQTWDMPRYEQVHPGAGFAPDLSTLDLLLNHPDEAGAMLRKAGGWKVLWSAA